jgi:hypothetical protein
MLQRWEIAPALLVFPRRKIQANASLLPISGNFPPNTHLKTKIYQGFY